MGDDEFEKELVLLINKHSLESGSSTPDYILARYLMRCLAAYSMAVGDRDSWWGLDDPPDMEMREEQ